MKAIIFDTFGTASEVAQVVDLPEPDAPGPGEIRVEMVAAPIHPSDLATTAGRHGANKPAGPEPLGSEGIGRVIDCGADVSHVSPGDLVAAPARGTWREIVVGPAKGVAPLPSGTEPLQLSMARTNPRTAWLMLTRFVTLAKGDWVIQDAANSSVGRYVIQLAQAEGWRTVNVVRRESLVPELRRAGADVVLVDGPDLDARVLEATGGARPRLAIDAVAGAATGRLARALADGGTLVNYGRLGDDQLILDAKDTVFRDLRLRGYRSQFHLGDMSESDVAAMYAMLAERVAAGVLAVPIEATYRLDDANAALEHAAREGRDGKVLFTFPGTVG